MSKTNSSFDADAKQHTSTGPQISDTPAITNNGALAWNVRDILFGPNGSGTGKSTPIPKSSKSSRRE